MGYSTEEGVSGRFRRFRENSKSETIVPESGHDYRIDRIKSRLGFGATVRGHLFYPVDSPDDPMRALFTNGFSTTERAYHDNAGEMARLGIATATYNMRRIINMHDIKNPLRVATDGGREMLNIMDEKDVVGETAVMGHSMGGIVAATIAILDKRIDYYLGDAIAGIEHENIWKQHLYNRNRIIKGIILPLFTMLAKRKDRLQTAYEYGADFIHNPTLIALQGLMLCRGPKITYYLKVLNNLDIPIALLLQERDEFFALDRQQSVINQEPALFGMVKKVAGAHMHPNFQPIENARLRFETALELRDKKRNDPPLAL